RQVRIYAETRAEHYTVPTVTSYDGMSLAQWREGDTRYALVGSVPGMSLQTLAQAARVDSANRGNKLAGTGQRRATRPDDRDRPLDDMMPAIIDDDYTVQPARM